jgi:serine phosphatase RsbU (regulator of sigma subunit)
MPESKDQAGSLNETPQIEGPSGYVEWVDTQSADVRMAYENTLQKTQSLVERLQQREEEFIRLARITEHVNRGITLEEVLDHLYEEARSVIPYNRIGFALIDRDRGMLVARWARSERPLSIKSGYEARLAGSTLQQIIETGKPRIINDLEAYLHAKPTSNSTSLIVREGMRSSLTCPLIVQGIPVGFIFFSSVDKFTYSNVHVAFFQQIAGQLATIVEKGRLYSALAEQRAIIEKQNLAMTHDLEMAHQVQQALIPQEGLILSGVEIAFAYEPVVQVGGDILDIIPLSEGRVVFFVGDAMGHGVRAALVMSIVKTALHSALQSDPHPAAVLTSINRVLGRFFSDSFVTAACCLLDPGRLQGELSVAGHAGPLWFRAGTEDVVQQGDSELPLGIAGDTEYNAVPFALGDGDTLVFFSDGIVEAFDPSGAQYGAERLKAQVLRYGGTSAQELCASIQRDQKRHCKDHIRQDDLTLLVVKATG